VIGARDGSLNPKLHAARSGVFIGDDMDLLPCPFCGHVGLDFREGSTFRWVAYSCSGCGMGNETRVQTLGAGPPDEWRMQAEVEAIKEWNTRVRAEAQPAQSHKVAYMDGIDWQHHVGHDVHGVDIYPTIEAALKHTHGHGCGVVRVRMIEDGWPVEQQREDAS
jgi:hypothetical protein